MTSIIAIQTGSIRLRPSHIRGDHTQPEWRRLLRVFADREWTEPLPIYTYLIEHSEGLILLDCGETSGPGYLPWWHPFFRFHIDLLIEPGQEIGPQLRARGIDPGRDLRSLVLSHLHHDHAGGLEYFRGTDIVVSRENYEVSQGLGGTMKGAVPRNWPSWFEPDVREFDGPPLAGFDASIPLTPDGTILAVPTPGHMAGHLSLVVRTPELTYFLAGDATYDQDLLRARVVEATSSDVAASLATMDRIADFAAIEPTVLLPAHDPDAERRLDERIPLDTVP